MRRPYSFLGALAVTVAVTAAALPAAADEPSEMRKSKYRGEHWTADLAPCREAIMRRESGFSYTAKNPTSSARGAYQFLDSQWRSSLVHMMRQETKRSYPEKLEMLNELDQVSIRYWPRFWQDFAFYRVANGTPNGLKHWQPLPGACR